MANEEQIIPLAITTFLILMLIGVATHSAGYASGREEGKEEIWSQAIAKGFGEYKIGENKKVIFVWHTNLAKTK